MKKLMYAVCAVVLLATACKKEQTTSATDTSRTSNDAAATDTTSTEGGAQGVTVTVDFVGLVCHIWDKSEAGVERAIVLRTPPSGPHQHNMNIGLPPESKADVDTLHLPINPDPLKQCSTGATCNVLMDGLAFRFVDAANNPLSTAFSPNANFTNFVTHLRDVPHKDKPFETKANLIDALFAATPSVNDPVVAGWFEIAGGKGDAEKFTCKGKFENDPTEQDFVKVAKITFALPSGAKLQVFKAGDTQWRDLAIPSFNFSITVDNDATISTSMSHFDQYARLSKKSVVLPNVETVNIQDCLGATTSTSGVDTVPGCSNSSWP